jgi:nicotinamide mononucleotide adenylyltransferase
MVADEDWESLVPRPVVDTIDDIGGVARLRQVAEDDGT